MCICHLHLIYYCKYLWRTGLNSRRRCTIFNYSSFIWNYNYLQLHCRAVIEFLLYRGFPRQIWPANYHDRSEGYFAGKIGRGNPRWSKHFNLSKKLLYTIVTFFRIPCKRWYKIRNFPMKKSAKIFRFSGW